MGVEGDGHGPRAQLTCFANHSRKNLLVAQMHAVEVTDGGHTGAKARRNFRNRMKDKNHMALGYQFAVPRFTGRLRPS